MPELPEVETTCRGIRSYLEGHSIVAVKIRQPRLRWPVPDELPDQLVDQPILKVSRRGKYIILQVAQGNVIVHLGMSGSLRIAGVDEDWRKHDHIEWLFEHHSLRFHDPRRFGCVLWTEQPLMRHKLLAPLGPEPLSNAFSADYLYQVAKSRRVAIKSLIMNSHVVVGVGNIYACEALFMAGIRPTRAANRISLARIQRLVQAIKQVLSHAIEQGGTTLRDFVNGFDQPGYFKQKLQVYGRKGENCYQCDQTLSEIKLAQRSTVFCQQCQI